MLLMAANHVVTVEKLVDAVWGDSPPSSARGQVQTCIARLRRALGDPELIDTSPSGYSIRIARDQLDYFIFDDGLTQGRAAAAEGRLNEALTHLDRALGTWSGPALADVPGHAAEVLAYGLEERRIMALEDRAEIRLGMGAHREIVDELVTLTTEYPLRERLWGFLMLALYRSGRQAEALTAYHTARASLIDELGIEPSDHLRRLEHAILAHDTSLSGEDEKGTAAGSIERQRPQELPADLPDFVGRAPLVDVLTTTLTNWNTDKVPIAIVTGAPGCGKTTLALHVAHRIRTGFPDGNLYACLYGSTAQPRSTNAVLGDFLRALGVAPATIPVETDQRINLLRSWMATRRLLIVLDDVGSEEQIAGLLPGVQGPAVLVTSRSRLAGIPGARTVNVGVMSAEDSVTLFGEISGRQRLAASPEDTAELAHMCGGLPLAVRIAGVRLAGHPHWSVRTLVDRLRDERHRLDELTHGDIGVRSLLTDVYESLTEQGQTLFRLLSTLDVHDFCAWNAAALLDCETGQAAKLLDEIADVRLLEASPSPRTRHPRYRLRELVRVFAVERRLAEDDEAKCDAAVTRALGALLAFAEEAHRRLYGGHFTVLHGTAPRWAGARAEYDRFLGDPISWFDEERGTLEAAVRQAAALKLDEMCWELATVSVTMYEARGLFTEWRATHLVALEATTRAENRRGQAAVLASLGSLGIAQHTEDDGKYLFRAMTLFEAIGDQAGLALTLRNLAHLDRIQGRPDSAVRRYEEALARFQAIGDLGAQAHLLNGLARSYLDLGIPERAETLAKESLAQTEQLGNRRLQAQALHRLGEVFSHSGQTLAAKAVFQGALDLTRELGDRVGQSYALNGLGAAALEQNELNAAEIHFNESFEISQTTNERNAQAQAVFGLGQVYANREEFDRAEQFFVQAANAFAAQENNPWYSRALDKLATVRRSAGRLHVRRIE
jgi:DNA-binding SARP family transcriptional activator